MTLSRKVRKSLAIFLVLAVWGVLLPVMLDLMTSLINWLSENNFTKIDIPYRFYNGTGWENRVAQIDISGILSIICMLVLFGAPIIAFVRIFT